MASGSLFNEPDLSRRWKLSDVVLSVEERKFHVHRCILAIWSPVFEKMFTSNFKEKHQYEIPLPGKKATEIQEMLSVMYLKEKKVTQETVFFLLKLAEEYDMAKLRSLCEECFIKHTTKDEAIEFLVLAQKYRLKQLADVCTERGAELCLEEIRNNENYCLLDLSYQLRLAEKRIEHLEEKGSYQKKWHLFSIERGFNFKDQVDHGEVL